MLLVLTKAEFLKYPSLARSLFAQSPPPGLLLRSNPDDISGLPDTLAESVEQFSKLTALLRTLAPDGRDVAIIDLHDTLIYCGANVEPWWRFTSIFQMALTKQSVFDLQRDLAEKPPKLVVIRSDKAERAQRYDFVWKPLHDYVKDHFDLRQTIGVFEVWTRPGAF
jgi:hypothetical protein